MPAPIISSSGSVVRTTSSGVDPTKTMSAYGNMQAANREAMAAMQDAVAGINENADAIGAAYTDIATASRAGAAAGASAKVEQIENANRSLQAFEADVNAPDNIIMQNRVRVAAAQREKAEVRPLLDQKLQTQIWDDPLQWAINQFEIPTLKARYNQAARTEQEGNRNISTVQQQVQAQQQIQPAMIGDAIKAEAAAKAVIDSSSALIAAAKTNTDARQIELQAATQKAAMLGNEAQFWLSVQRLNADKQTLAFNQKAMSREDEGLAEVNAKRRFMNMAEFSPAYWHTLTPVEKRPHLAGVNTPAFGASPEESFRMVQENGWARLQQTDPTSYGFLKEQFSRKEDMKKVESEHMNDAKFRNMSSVDQQAFLFGKLIADDSKILAENKKDYGKLPAGHFAKLRPADIVMLTDLKKTQIKPDNEYLKMVNETLAQNPSKQITQDDFYEWTMAQALADPRKIDKLAEDLSSFHRDGQNATWAYGGGFKWGVPRPERYILGGKWAESTGTQSTGLFGQNTAADRPVEAWNVSSVKHAIVVRSAAERQKLQMFQLLKDSAAQATPLLP